MDYTANPPPDSICNLLAFQSNVLAGLTYHLANTKGYEITGFFNQQGLLWWEYSDDGGAYRNHTTMDPVRTLFLARFRFGLGIREADIGCSSAIATP